MASKTKRTEMKRSQKKAGQGNKRKAKLRTKGTTRTEAELFGDK